MRGAARPPRGSGGTPPDIGGDAVSTLHEFLNHPGISAVEMDLVTVEECFSGPASFANALSPIPDSIRSRRSARLRNASSGGDENTIGARSPRILSTARSAMIARRSGGPRIPTTGSGTAKRIRTRLDRIGPSSKPGIGSAACEILQTTTWLPRKHLSWKGLISDPGILQTTTLWLWRRFCPKTESAHSHAERPTDQRNSTASLAPEMVVATNRPPPEPEPAIGCQIPDPAVTAPPSAPTNQQTGAVSRRHR